MLVERSGPWVDALDAWYEFGLRLCEPARQWGDQLAIERTSDGYRILVGKAAYECPSADPEGSERRARRGLLRAFLNFIRGRSKARIAEGRAISLEAAREDFGFELEDSSGPGLHQEFSEYWKLVQDRWGELSQGELVLIGQLCRCAEQDPVGPGPKNHKELASELGINPSTVTRRKQDLLRSLGDRFGCQAPELLFAMICLISRKPQPAKGPGL